MAWHLSATVLLLLYLFFFAAVSTFLYIYIYYLFQELHEFFPYLLSNVFGFDGTHGWQLKAFNQQLHADFQQVMCVCVCVCACVCVCVCVRMHVSIKCIPISVYHILYPTIEGGRKT